jgi:ketosteroid isomerase-like protein
MRTVLFILAFACHGLLAQSKGQEARDILAVLNQQVEAWNGGDIDSYMSGYWRSDSTIFVSGGNVTTGYDSVLARYKRGYATRETMGKLEFEEVGVRLISEQIGVATGIWRIHRSQDQPWGRFTLLVEKKPEGWRVTYDHTSVGKEMEQ